MLTDRDPDYVVLGETRTYSFEAITTAIRLIERGARFIATNPDADRPVPRGPLPATGSVAALITKATGVEPVLHRQAQPTHDAQRAEPDRGALARPAVMVGDRMDTDVISGLEAGMRTVLVLTGSTRPSTRSTGSRTAPPGWSTPSRTSSTSWTSSIRSAFG